MSTTSKVSSTQIILFSVLGVALAPIIILAITAFAKGSMGVRNLLLKFKLKWLWFALEALVAKYWFNHSNYKDKFSHILHFTGMVTTVLLIVRFVYLLHQKIISCIKQS